MEKRAQLGGMEGRLKKGGEWKGEMWGVELDACGDAAVVCGQGPHAILPERCDPSGCSPDVFAAVIFLTSGTRPSY